VAGVVNAATAVFFASQTEPLSIAWTLTYRSPERTLETTEVDAAHQRILAALEKALPATVRR